MERKFNHEYLKKRRKEQNISQEKIAKALGFKNSSTYSKYENGDSAIKADMLPVIADILDTPIMSFFTFDSSKTERGKQPEEVS